MPHHPINTYALPGPKDVRYGIASSREELEAAFRLAHHAYVRSGYIDPQPGGLKVNVFSALPETTTFVAKVGKALIATASLVADSPLGLPMEPILPDELAALRRKGCKLGEVSALADRRSGIRRSLPVLLKLSRLLFNYARSRAGLTDLCILVSPRHEAFYRKHLRFRSLGGLRAQRDVCGHAAVALRLSFERAERECRNDARLWRVFGSQNPKDPALEKTYQMTAEDVRYFLEERSDALAKAPPEARAHLQSIYPALAAEPIGV